MKIASSLIDEATYNAETQEMTVKFLGTGGTYVYSRVPQVMWDAFLVAPSQGGFFARQIKAFPKQYPFRKVEVTS